MGQVAKLKRIPDIPPRVLEYGHAEPSWWHQEALRVLDWMNDQVNLARYWMWYYGGPRWCIKAGGAGVAATVFMLWITGGWLKLWCVGIGLLVFNFVLQMAPERNEW